jgi:hypothetical protein
VSSKPRPPKEYLRDFLNNFVPQISFCCNGSLYLHPPYVGPTTAQLLLGWRVSSPLPRTPRASSPPPARSSACSSAAPSVELEEQVSTGLGDTAPPPACSSRSGGQHGDGDRQVVIFKIDVESHWSVFLLPNDAQCRDLRADAPLPGSQTWPEPRSLRVSSLGSCATLAMHRPRTAWGALLDHTDHLEDEERPHDLHLAVPASN